MHTITYRKDAATVLTPTNHHYHFVLINVMDGSPDAVIYTDRDKAMADAEAAAMENLLNDMDKDEVPSFDSIDDLLEFHNDHFRLDATFVDVLPSRIY